MKIEIDVAKENAGAVILALYQGEQKFQKEMLKASRAGQYKTATEWRDRAEACKATRVAVIEGVR